MWTYYKGCILKIKYPMKTHKKIVVAYTDDNHIPIYAGTDEHRQYLQEQFTKCIDYEINILRNNIYLYKHLKNPYYHYIDSGVDNKHKMGDLYFKATKFGWVLKQDTEYLELLNEISDLIHMDDAERYEKYQIGKESKETIQEEHAGLFFTNIKKFFKKFKGNI